MVYCGKCIAAYWTQKRQDYCQLVVKQVRPKVGDAANNGRVLCPASCARIPQPAEWAVYAAVYRCWKAVLRVRRLSFLKVTMSTLGTVNKVDYLAVVRAVVVRSLQFYRYYFQLAEK